MRRKDEDIKDMKPENVGAVERERERERTTLYSTWNPSTRPQIV